MFSIFKKKNTPSFNTRLPLTTDIHSHILPGLDDGSPDIETSLLLIEGLIKMGITHSIATPHIIGDLYRNNNETISNALKILQNAINENQLEFKVNAAAEYMLDDSFFDLLRKKVPLLTLKENIVLTEFSYSEKPYSVENMIFEIITEGYQPILAHPERYPYYQNDYKQYHHLKDLGFSLQLNLLSLSGYYGKGSAKAAAYLIKNNLISYVGSDMHHARHLNALMGAVNHSSFLSISNDVLFNEDFKF